MRHGVINLERRRSLGSAAKRRVLPEDLDEDLKNSILDSLGYPYPAADFFDGVRWIWWRPEEDPREASSFTVIWRDSDGDYFVEDWQQNDPDDREEDEVWNVDKVCFRDVELLGHRVPPEVAANVGVELIYNGESLGGDFGALGDGARPEPKFPFLKKRWIRERYGKGRPEVVLDPFTQREVWFVSGGSYWFEKAEKLGIPCLVRKVR